MKSREVASGLEASGIDLGPGGASEVKRILEELERAGRVYRVKGNRYAVPAKLDLLVGRLSVKRSGDGFVIPDDGAGADIFVRAGSQDSALDGDRVVVRIEHRPRGLNPVGRVIKVLERARSTLVGTFHRGRGANFMSPRDTRVTRDVLVPEGEDGGARDGELVVVRLHDFGSRRMGPVGVVETVLGSLSDPGIDVLAILHEHSIPIDFPPEVLEHAREIARTGRPEPAPGRVDRRDLLVFTIDPADAKDHDDALSIESAGNGNWEVGVHIADVSHYVERGSPLDLEALHRGTSVYLVDRVVPMLPHELSSDLCSLRAGQDRYAVSVFLTLDPEGNVRKTRFERTLIRSRHRLDYEQVQKVLEGRAVVDDSTDALIHQIDQLARVLRRTRFQRGSLDFDLPEARVVLGEEGEPLDIQRVERLESHRLIEDFMLLANEVVALEADRRDLPILFRVHEGPKAEKVASLRKLLASVGHTLPAGRIRSHHLQRILARVEGTPEAALVSTVILRSMQRAHYSTTNVGHFGLAADHYGHFTSPIRRYPDLVTHRVITRVLIEGQAIPEEWGGESLEATAEHSNFRERGATQAERDSIDLKKVEYMERHLGDHFEGTVSGIVAFGFFALLQEVFVEGLVHVNTLTDDFYHFREEEYALVGEGGGRRFRLGDRVRIQVARVDREARQIDFVLSDR